jgi:predicted RNA-binding Zn-ribbon protein involved in translation (DUF1610 family)|tara:strand:- start:16794 stop:17207 length:414 start_codon:yes stop_codon:yes gene_type:complete
MKEPESMEECVYFTRRDNEKGKIKVWVFREKCPNCNDELMGKPKDPKTGKPKTRADYYECPGCKHTIPKEEYEETLTANIKYTCPHCSNEDAIEVPFKRKKIRILNEETQKKKSVEALRFQCQKCGKDIDVIKKMKS